MLASVADDVPRGEGWVFEPKYDGIRVLAFVDGGRAQLVTRNGLSKTAQFPEIVDALIQLYKKRKRPFVLDGEVVVMRDDTPLRFQELQSRMHVKDRSAIEGHREATPAALMVFDLLVDGKKTLVTESWRVRRERLAALLLPPGARMNALRLSDVGEDGDAMLNEARARGWEGIMAKRADAPYEVGRRSRAWQKVKIDRRQEFVVGGWTEPRNSRQHIGAILLGYHDADGELVYAGHTGGGFTRTSLSEVYKRLKPLVRKTSPFTTTPKTNETAHWVTPELVVEVKFSEWTAGGHLRQPIFLGVRDDKSPEDVVREPVSKGVKARKSSAKKVTRAKARPSRGKTDSSRSVGRTGRVSVGATIDALNEIEENGGDGELSLPTGTLEVTNLGKVYFPKSKHTKGDLMRYYTTMSPYLLPAMADRALVMKRFPNGVKGKAFYQQKAPDRTPDSVRVESVSDEGLETAKRLVGGDLATLLYLVQLGAISVDPWHSRVQSVKNADYAIIDLDPGPKARFGRVVEVALAVKETLDELGLHAVPKTSGASGIHIVLPLAPHVPNDGARTIAEVVATRVAERHPKLATIERAVKVRSSGAVYVDFLQNIRGKTVAGVYSVRAQPTAMVSTPLDWNEVDSDLNPTAFTIDTVPERVNERGDLWAKGMKRPNKLDALLGKGRRRG